MGMVRRDLWMWMAERDCLLARERPRTECNNKARENGTSPSGFGIVSTTLSGQAFSNECAGLGMPTGAHTAESRI